MKFSTLINLKKLGIFAIFLLSLIAISFIVSAQFGPPSQNGFGSQQGFGQPQGPQPFGGQGFGQGMPQGGFNGPQGFGNQGQSNGFGGSSFGGQMGGMDFGVNTSAADPEFVAKEKFTTGMTTAYNWIAANSSDFASGCKTDRDALVQKLNYVIQQSKETSAVCQKYSTEAANCNPETFCTMFSNGKMPFPPDAKIAMKAAGYNPDTITIDQMNEDFIVKICTSQFDKELEKARQKNDEMKNEIKSQLSDFRKGCEQFKQMESQRNQGFKLPGFGQQMGPPPGGWGQMGPGGQGPQPCLNGTEPDGRGGCKQSQPWQGQNWGPQGPGGNNGMQCSPDQHPEFRDGKQMCVPNNQQIQCGPDQHPEGNNCVSNNQQGGGCQGTPPQCECGWNCNTGSYACNPCNNPQQPPIDQPQPGPTPAPAPEPTPTVEPAPEPQPEPAPASEPTPEPTATTAGIPFISNIATAFASLLNLQEAANTTTEQPTSTQQIPEQPIGQAPFQQPFEQNPQQGPNGFGGPQGFGMPQGFGGPQGSQPFGGQGFGQGMPPGGFGGQQGFNQQNGPQGFGGPQGQQGMQQGGFGGQPGFGPPQDQGFGPQMGGGMPPEKMCELSDDEIVETFAVDVQQFMPQKGQIEYQCKIEAGNVARELNGLKLGIAQCKANAALDCAAKQEMVKSCDEIQNDTTPIAKSIVENMCRKFGITSAQQDAKGKLYDLAKKMYNSDPALANQFGDTADKTLDDQKKLDIISYVLGNGDYGKKLAERADKLKELKARLESNGNVDSETIALLDSQINELSAEGTKFSNALDITRLGYLFGRPSQ